MNSFQIIIVLKMLLRINRFLEIDPDDIKDFKKNCIALFGCFNSH